MQQSAVHFGTPQSRVDGVLKVNGRAAYAADFPAADLLYGFVVTSAIAKGRIVRIDDSVARAVPGVLEVFTHANRPGTAWFDYKYHDEVGPPGHPFRPLSDDVIHFSAQPIALVVADSFEGARHAASLVEVEYLAVKPKTDVAAGLDVAYEPPKRRSGIAPPPKPRGDADAALASAPIRVVNDYRVAVEHHSPMELQATTVIWQGEDRLLVHDKTQGVQNVQSYVASVFGLKVDNVRVVSPFVGGAFGIGLRPQYPVFLAVMAALALKRSVQLALTRDQTFGQAYRPDTLQTVKLGAGHDGRLLAVLHDAVAGTSQYEDQQEVVVNWSGLLYRCDNVKLGYKLVKLDTATPGDMRAPGATLGVFALESAMDELAYAANIDPVQLRLLNYVERDENQNKDITSKALRECYAEGAAKFGWDRRTAAPRSMRDGRELVGMGMATGVWEALFQKTAARVTLLPDGTAEVATATSDIGTGTYTVLTIIAADALGIPMQDVSVKLADSSLPKSPVEGGSWTAASAGTAVQNACNELLQQLLKHAKAMKKSPLADAKASEVRLNKGRIERTVGSGESVAIADVMRASGLEKIDAEGAASPSLIKSLTHVSYTHSAVFAEVRIDEQLGVIRVSRIVSAIAAGKIINPKTARSQIEGGVVMGIGMALHEESLRDHTFGRIMNHNFAEYHIAANADVHDIDVIFVDEHDHDISPIGVKGVGEIGIVGTAAAIANAVYHATGRRIRELPITLDKLM